MSWIDKSFPTETAAMTFSSSSGSHVDWGFRIGLSMIVLFGAIEGFSVGYYYLPHRNAGAAATVVAPPKVALAPTRATPAPPVAAPAATAATLATPALATSDRLLKDAVALREKGDTTNALAKLNEATQRDPKNANALAEMASIYESIDKFERSNETWQKIQEIGPTAGPVYETAMLKLRKGAAATPAPAPTPAAEATAEAATTTTRAGADGIPEGSTFGIAEVSTTDTPDPDAETNMMLRIGVKKKPNAVVDHTRVKIQVFFYDTVDDKDIKLTDAEVNYEWLTPSHDWASTSPEVLAVTYVRPKNKAKSQEEALSAAAQSIIPGKKTRPSKAAAPDDSGRRKYLGYIVRVYYNDKLQAQKADPTKLLTLYPSPNTASSP